MSACANCAPKRERWKRFPCASFVQRTASILLNALQWGTVPATEAEIGLSPAYRGRGLRAFNNLPD